MDRISAIHRSAELGVAIFNEQYWGQGLGTEAMHLLVGYGFSFLNLQRISLTSFDDTLGVQHAYAKLGFQVVGRLRAHVFYKGTYHDLIYMDILATEYEKRSQAAKST